MRTLTVSPPLHSYPVFIGSDLFASVASLLAPYLPRQCVLISNETVAPLYLQQWQHFLDTVSCRHFSILVPDGEKYKNLSVLNTIYDRLMEERAERNTVVIALGGGVIGDMAGFAAATYQRGMPFIQVPTTLLSQVDSSVGGKTAVNHPLGKNMIGAFYQPQAVFADLSTLDTLPPREFSAGMAEVIKYALLGDYAFLQWLEENMPLLMAKHPASLEYAVYHCCSMKAEIVAADEKEKGIRAHLNLGHTFGHAIEAQMGYGNWLHGEAVAAGTVLACRLSECLGTLTAADTVRVKELFQAASLPVDAPAMPLEAWITHMRHDKKVRNGTLRFITLDALGQAAVRDDITADMLETILPTSEKDNS